LKKWSEKAYKDGSIVAIDGHDNLRIIDLKKFRHARRRFTVPNSALTRIPEAERYIRTIGGSAGLETVEPPHVFISWGLAAYSDEAFVVRNPQICLKGRKEDAEYLRALSAILNSNIFQYLLFFYSPSSGIARNKVGLSTVKRMPMPNLTDVQVRQLAALHRELSGLEDMPMEKSEPELTLFSLPHTGLSDRAKALSSAELQWRLDSQVQQILKLPEATAVIAEEFSQVRLLLNKGKRGNKAVSYPSHSDLLQYAHALEKELDDFAGGDGFTHNVSIKRYDDLIECTVEFCSSEHDTPPNVVGERTSRRAPRAVWDKLSQRFSQWVYVQRGLRIYDGNKVTLYKTPRLIDWTRTKALQDADDIIAEVMAAGRT
jgi:hypothetical protein